MKTKFCSAARILVLLWLVLVPPLAAQYLKSSTDVDLNLFALRLLENLALPEVDDSFPEKLSEYRRTLLEYKEFFAGKQVDPDIIARYEDAIELKERVQALIKTGWEIEASARKERKENVASQAISSSATGFRSGTGVLLSGVEPITATSVGVAMAVGNFFWHAPSKLRAINEAKDAMIEAEFSKLAAFFDECSAKNKATAALMTDKYGWRPQEAGFLDSGEEQGRLEQLYEQGNLAAVAQLTDRNLKNRPRDPFAFFQAASVRYDLALESESLEDMLHSADMYVQGANAFPSSVPFLKHRAALLFSAAKAQTMALFFQTTKLDLIVGDRSLALKALQLLHEFKGMEITSLTPEFKMYGSYVAAYLGEFKDALVMANEAYASFEGNAFFHLTYARLASRAEEYDRALSELKKAIRPIPLDLADLLLIKEAPDFTQLASDSGSEWQALFDVKYTWDVDWGFFHDDVRLRNDSAFPITEVVFAPRITRNGKLYAPILKVDIIAPGEVHRWPKVFSIPGSKADEISIQLACTQSEQNRALRRKAD